MLSGEQDKGAKRELGETYEEGMARAWARDDGGDGGEKDRFKTHFPGRTERTWWGRCRRGWDEGTVGNLAWQWGGWVLGGHTRTQPLWWHALRGRTAGSGASLLGVQSLAPHQMFPQAAGVNATAKWTWFLETS